MCRVTPLFNIDLDMLVVDLGMLATDRDSECGYFKPWWLVLIMVVQNNLEKHNKQKNNRDGCAGSLVFKVFCRSSERLKGFLLFWRMCISGLGITVWKGSRITIWRGVCCSSERLKGLLLLRRQHKRMYNRPTGPLDCWKNKVLWYPPFIKISCQLLPDV